MPGGEPDAFELVAGARRYRASKLAGRETIPASIRDLTDAQCLELQLIELSVVRKNSLRCLAPQHVVHM
jgi:ParB/RepB/Spo0J family partition protein